MLLAGCGSPVPTAPTASVVPTSEAFFTHVVDEGETCNFIAFTYNVTEQALIAANGLAADCSDLYLGQTLVIPKPAPGTLPVAGAPPAAASRIPLERAEELVRAHIYSTQPEMNPTARFPLAEITPEEVWDALGAQVFKVSGEVLLNEAFVVRSGQVTPIGESFGGDGVHALLLAELDGQSPPELVYAYEFGSGVRRSSVGVYRVEGQGVRAYELADFQFPGAVALALRSGQVVVSGKPDAGGVLRDWRELGTLGWVSGGPVFAPAQ